MSYAIFWISVLCAYLFGFFYGYFMSEHTERKVMTNRRRDTLQTLKSPEKSLRGKDLMPSTPTPEKCESHQVDYKPHAWEAYTLAELGWWVHLLTKRAEHRLNSEKRAKDLYDAGDYLSMMVAKLEEAKLKSRKELVDVLLTPRAYDDRFRII